MNCLGPVLSCRLIPYIQNSLLSYVSDHVKQHCIPRSLVHHKRRGRISIIDITFNSYLYSLTILHRTAPLQKQHLTAFLSALAYTSMLLN